MGYNVTKTPFNLADFLAQKAPSRPIRRRFPSVTRLGSMTRNDPVEDEPADPAEGQPS